jgi:hypothetical protein
VGHESEQIYRDWITKEGFRPVPEVPIAGGQLVLKERYIIEFDIRDDLFVYCVSHYQSRRMEIRFASGDDSWVEIVDPDGFFSAIDNAMTKLGHTSKGLKAVRYRSKRFASKDALPRSVQKFERRDRRMRKPAAR